MVTTRRVAQPQETAQRDEPDSADDRFDQAYGGPKGLLGQLSVVSHKPVALRYIWTAFFFFVVAGISALLIRVQLAQPENQFLDPMTYNRLFTMHGTTMMFIFAVPIAEGFANYLIPLMVGARDLPFPRLNAFSYFMFLFGAVFLYSSFLFNDVPAGGWFAYVPLTGPVYSPGQGIDFWLISLTLLEVSGVGAAIELIVCIVKLRARGMSLGRMPLYVWAILVTAVSIVFAFAPLLVASTLLEFDRKFGTHFFDPAAGGDPLLWQHLFWIFGHPEVYIQFLPATGIVSMVVPVFARRPIPTYSLVVLALVGTAFLSFGLWVHHMFAVGIPLLAFGFFAAASFTIAIPSGIQIFSWIATLWNGRAILATPLLFVLGFVAIFVLGGMTGVMVAAVPFDWQVHDSYFVVAHFHYVLIGGAVFPTFAGFYYWIPKWTGRMLDERLGKWNFWLLFLGFNLTFFPMHITGLLGMPRRYYTYQAGLGWDDLNLVSTVGAFVIALGVLVFIWNVLQSAVLKDGKAVGGNPWRADSLEWATDSPAPSYNFRTLPAVRGRYPLWEAGQAAVEPSQPPDLASLSNLPMTWRATLVTSALDARPESVAYLPGPSYWPLGLALSVLALAIGFLGNFAGLIALGLLGSAVSLIGWVWPIQQERAATAGENLELPEGLSAAAAGSRSAVWWGLVLFLAFLAVMLASLVFSYYYLRSRAPTWPPVGVEMPGLVLWSGVAALLLLSVGPMYFAELSIRGGHRGRLAFGLVASFGLGTLAFVLQFVEYTTMPFTPQSHVFGSLFFTLSGFHSVLLLSGLGMSALVQVWTWLGYFDQRRYLGVQNTALYWYFVVVAGLVVYGVLYLSPRLMA